VRDVIPELKTKWKAGTRESVAMDESNQIRHEEQATDGRETSIHEYDRADPWGSGAAFFTGLFAGAVIGTGLGLLFAPRRGSELREQFAESAANVSRTVSKTVDDLAETGRDAYQRGREVYERTRTAVDRAGETIGRMASDTAKDVSETVTGAADTATEQSGSPTFRTVNRT
jgi:gas vesicle protein